MDVRPQALIIAGPNGAGKSTCAARFVPRAVRFVNADNIARELEPGPGRSAAIAAGRMLLAQLDDLERERESFALETNLANRTLATRIPRWRDAGYHVSLFFIWIPSADMAVRRVAQRVRSGGHDIPEATIRRRYRVGLRLFFEVYQPLVASWRLYDNSGTAGPILIAHSLRAARDSDEKRVRVKQGETWERLRRELDDE